MRVKKSRLLKLINKFRKSRVLVVGDLILDRYIFGNVERISPEAPVPVVWANREEFLGGGAANVALNIVSLGGKVSICGVLGRDHYGDLLSSIIKKGNIDTELIIKDKSRPTTLKTRIIAQHQQVVRLDWESVEFLPLDINRKIINRLYKDIDKFDAVIIEDYGKGVVNPYLVKELVNICHKKNKIITVDPKEEHFDYYENVTALTPNLKEAQYAANMKVRNKEEITILGNIIMQKLKPKSLLVTLGEEGMELFLEGDKSWHIPTTALEVFDVTGAGDTVIAVFSLALSCGADFKEAALLSNIAAGIVVGKLGAATVNTKEFKERLDIVQTDLIIN